MPTIGYWTAAHSLLERFLANIGAFLLVLFYRGLINSTTLIDQVSGRCRLACETKSDAKLEDMLQQRRRRRHAAWRSER